MILSINKKARARLGQTARYYKVIYGAVILITGTILLIQPGNHAPQKYLNLAVSMVGLGLFFVIYGYIGKKILSQKIQIQIDSKHISVRKSLWANTVIPIKNIVAVKFLPTSIEFCFSDYSKKVDLSLLSQSELEHLKSAISECCAGGSIEIE